MMDIISLHNLILSAHSKSHCKHVVSEIILGKLSTSALVKSALSKNQEVARRAAWVLTHLDEIAPEKVKKYHSQLVIGLSPNNHPAVNRNFLRILQNKEIPEDLMGVFINKCYEFLLNSNCPTAIKIHAITNLTNVCLKEPELANELITVVEEGKTQGSAGYNARAKKSLNILRKL